MRSSLWLIGAVAAGLMLGFTIVTMPNRVAFGPSSALAQDDNSEYEAEQARQRDEDAEQQQRYQQEQQEQQQESAQEQNEAQRQEEEQRHQEEMDRINSEREQQQQN